MINILYILIVIVFIVILIPTIGIIILMFNDIYYDQFGDYLIKPKKKEK